MPDFPQAAAAKMLTNLAPAGIAVGSLLGVSDTGRPFVDFPGNLAGPVEARSIVPAPAGDHPADGSAVPVLLVFENGDPDLPIIIGFVRDTLFGPPSPRELSLPRPAAATLDGKRIVLDANQEIILRCGESSITLRRDGKIVLLGTNIVSRASEVNKIKGGNVAIN